ncbi:hypothetical protein [Streptomyces sp. NPDC051364]|uniref:hypothetical protein n=1 Tax=Streptomyces sp. NPDC051364 TaxID=3155799 RepID=UPI00342E3F68
MREAAEAGKLAPLGHTHQNPSYATAAGAAVSYWTYLSFRPVRRECVPGVRDGANVA